MVLRSQEWPQHKHIMKQTKNNTLLLPTGTYTGLVDSVNRNVTTVSGVQHIFEMDVPNFREYDIVLFDRKDAPSPALKDVQAGDVLTFQTKHRTKLDPNTGRENTRAFHSAKLSEDALLAAIAAATK